MAIARPPRQQRRRSAHAGRPILALGAPRGGLRDLYHGVMSMPLWGLLTLIFSFYIALNLIFAGLYLLDPNGITHVKPDDFADAFFFSVQTISTVGYGTMEPISPYANAVVTLECFFNLVLVAITTGVIFAQVSKPTARVLFTRVATVTEFDGKPHLMLRAINERSNQILEAEVMVNLARQSVNAEGHPWRRFQDLAVTRQRSPLFALSWTIMHPLDESSPLFGATHESLIAEDAEIIVVLSGIDDTFAQRIHARHTYGAEDILWGKEFENVLTIEPDGRWVLDYRKFHSLRDAAAKPAH